MPQAIVDFAASRGMIPMRSHVYDSRCSRSKTPVTKLADFAGKRIRVLASEGEQASVSALGGAPVPMSLAEVLPALQQGTIDGVNAAMRRVRRVPLQRRRAATLLDTRLLGLVPIAS